MRSSTSSPLADRPELAGGWAELQWCEWGTTAAGAGCEPL